MSEPRTDGKEEEKQPPGSEKVAQIHNHSTNGVININSNITIHNFFHNIFHNIFHNSEPHSTIDHPQSYQRPTAEPPLSSGTQSNSDPAPLTPVLPINQSSRANTTQSVGSTSTGSFGLPPRVNIILKDPSRSTARNLSPEPPPYMHPSTSLRDSGAQGDRPILSEESRARVDAVWNMHRGPFEEMMRQNLERQLDDLTEEQYLDRIFTRLGHPPKPRAS